MFKKWISVKAPSKSDNNEIGPNNGESEADGSVDRNKKSVFAMKRTKRPTIIRPNDPPPAGKIRRPPRPPPPKFNTSGCVSAFSLDPPSYEEVLLADAEAKKKRLQDPASRKRPAPQVPQKMASSAGSSDSPVLIDFDTSLTNWDDFTPTSGHIADLHELEDIFSNFSLSSDQVSSVPATSVPTTQNLLDDIYFCAEQLNTNQQILTSSNCYDSSRPMNQRPVPLPRRNISNLSNVTNDMFSLQLWTNSTQQPTDLLGNLFNNESGNFTKLSDEQPPLPPRPLSMNEGTFVENNETSSYLISDQIPNLPPKPQNYKEVQDRNDSNGYAHQRLEPHGIALYDYTTSQNDELSFQINETITLIHRINDEWLYGCIGEREGMFPRSFVHVVIPLPDDTEFENNNPMIKVGPRCLALYDFVGDSEDEINFHVGEMIPLISRVSDYWFKGVVNGRIGLIPANFVRVIEDLPTADEVGDVCTAEITQDFAGGLNYELCCKKGDVVTIVYPIDNEWVMAQHKSKAGILPWTILEVKH